MRRKRELYYTAEQRSVRLRAAETEKRAEALAALREVAQYTPSHLSRAEIDEIEAKIHNATSTLRWHNAGRGSSAS